MEQALSISIRKTTWLPLDEAWESLLNVKTQTLPEVQFTGLFAEMK